MAPQKGVLRPGSSGYVGPRVGSLTFTIASVEDGTKFTANFGDGGAIVTEGYAGWQVISRPREVGIVEWQGRNPLAIEIPFLIDYYFDVVESSPGIRCENMVQNLETLCGVGTHMQPPICTIDAGGVIPHDKTIYGGHRWVIENLSWDKAVEIRSETSGRRMRCGGTLTVRQYKTAQDILRRLGPNAKAVKPRIYTVRKGDNLGKIAAKYYGNAGFWKKIADANGLRDRRSIAVGRKIQIPYL